MLKGVAGEAGGLLVFFRCAGGPAGCGAASLLSAGLLLLLPLLLRLCWAVPGSLSLKTAGCAALLAAGCGSTRPSLCAWRGTRPRWQR